MISMLDVIMLSLGILLLLISTPGMLMISLMWLLKLQVTMVRRLQVRRY